MRGRKNKQVHENTPHDFDDPLKHLIGTSRHLEHLRRRIPELATREEAVLIIGETGAGKDLVAASLHKCGPRKGEPCVTINCYDFLGAPEMARSKLFGFKRGSFTGASKDTPGAIADAGSGTLFLDEFGRLPAEVQGQLLRAIDSREYQMVGSSRNEPASCRFVAATNVKSNSIESRDVVHGIREDMFDRFKLKLFVKPLRERRTDIVNLFFHFCDQECRTREIPFPDSIPFSVGQLLLLYDWPRNVRQLQAAVIEFVDYLAEKAAHSGTEDVDSSASIGPYEKALDTLIQADRVESSIDDLVMPSGYTWFVDRGTLIKDYFSERWTKEDIHWSLMSVVGLVQIPREALRRFSTTQLIEVSSNRPYRETERPDYFRETIEKRRIHLFLAKEAISYLSNIPLKYQDYICIPRDDRMREISDWGVSWLPAASPSGNSVIPEAYAKKEATLVVKKEWSLDTIKSEAAKWQVALNNGNQSRAAEELGIGRDTIRRLIKVDEE